MRHLAVVAAVLGLVMAAVAADPPTDITFGKADVGKLPAGWAAARTGPGEGSVWVVAADPSAPTGFALAQTAERPNPLYNLCVLAGSKFQDGEVSARVKAVGGKLDQGGGVVWRYADPDNYYVCRYNPLETNLRVYHVKAGTRTQLATKEGMGVGAGQWFTVSIRHAGNRIECSLDGVKHLEVTDDTFPAAGKVGLWCKADARSHFDRLRFTPAGSPAGK